MGITIINLILSGCFSKDQVYLDGILRILRHRQSIDFPMLIALGKVSEMFGCVGGEKPECHVVFYGAYLFHTK